MEERKNSKERQKCNIFIEDRCKLSISGVEDIDTFDETNFVAITTEGALIVKGTDFHISKLNVDTGELIVEGTVDSCVFNSTYRGKAGGGLLSRLFR